MEKPQSIEVMEKTVKIESVFSNKEYISILKKYGCNWGTIISLEKKWNKPHRAYHNEEHLGKVLKAVNNIRDHRKTVSVPMIDIPNVVLPTKHTSQMVYDMFVLASFFHDAVYDPHATDGKNEKESAALFLESCDKAGDLMKIAVQHMILATIDHTKYVDHGSMIDALVTPFLVADIATLSFGTLDEMVEDERKIRKEFDWVPQEAYKVGRTNVLIKFAEFINKNKQQWIKNGIVPNKETNDGEINKYVDWSKNNI